jgi:hypothetical protein
MLTVNALGNRFAREISKAARPTAVSELIN